MTATDKILEDLRNARIAYESARVGTRPLGQSAVAMREADELSNLVCLLDELLSNRTELPTTWTHIHRTSCVNLEHTRPFDHFEECFA